MKQRLFVAAATVAGGWFWMRAESSLAPESGAGGITLLDASAGPLGGLLVAIAWGIPALALGVIAGAVGNPLAAAFVFSGALLLLVADGGNSLGFLWQVAPGDYLPLFIEALAWFSLLALILWLTGKWRTRIREAVPWLVTDMVERQPLLRGLGHPSSLLAAAVCALVAGLLAHVMIRSWDVGQVLGALVFAFAVGGLVAWMAVPGVSPGPILFSPLLLAAYGYGHVFLTVDTPTDLQHAAYRSEQQLSALPGLAWTLPAHFASAGLLGCILGIGIAQGLLVGHKHRKPAGAPPAASATPSRI